MKIEKVFKKIESERSGADKAIEEKYLEECRIQKQFFSDEITVEEFRRKNKLNYKDE